MPEPQYVVLPSSSDEAFENEDGYVAPGKGKRENTGNDVLFFWTCIATLCSTALSIIFFSASILRDNAVHKFEMGTAGGPLRRPSTYVNLQKALIKSNHTFPPISNFPQVVYQISRSDSSRKMTEDDRGFRATIGTVYPDARHIHITDKISTIVQFRHIDYGMERCYLKSVVPPKTAKFDPSSSVQDFSTVDVWGLDATTEISRHIGDTWKYAPRRTKKLTSIIFPGYEAESYEFACPSNEFSTFELACKPGLGDKCSVDFWQDQRAKPVAGIYLLQHQTNVTQPESSLP